MNPIDTVLAFVSCWSTNKDNLVYGCFDKYFTSETHFENVGICTTIGIQAAQKVLESFVKKTGAHTVDIDVVNVMCSGQQVLLERLEHFRDEAGEEFMTLRAIGSFKVEKGKIIHWRDYLDSAYYEKWAATQAAA